MIEFSAEVQTEAPASAAPDFLHDLEAAAVLREAMLTQARRDVRSALVAFDEAHTLV